MGFVKAVAYRLYIFDGVTMNVILGRFLLHLVIKLSFSDGAEAVKLRQTKVAFLAAKHLMYLVVNAENSYDST